MMVEDMSRCVFSTLEYHVLYPFFAYLLALPGTYYNASFSKADSSTGKDQVKEYQKAYSYERNGTTFFQ
jgi:hypothetical protein